MGTASIACISTRLYRSLPHCSAGRLRGLCIFDLHQRSTSRSLAHRSAGRLRGFCICYLRPDSTSRSLAQYSDGRLRGLCICHYHQCLVSRSLPHRRVGRLGGLCVSHLRQCSPPHWSCRNYCWFAVSMHPHYYLRCQRCLCLCLIFCYPGCPPYHLCLLLRASDARFLSAAVFLAPGSTPCIINLLMTLHE